MSTECAQVVTLSDKQKTTGKSVPPSKNICKPFTLRLILGVPILKDDNKILSDFEGLFAKYAKTVNVAMNSAFSSDNGDSDAFWEHVVIGVNSIVSQLEDAARDGPSGPNGTHPFSVIMLDFAWLNSQLGHHLAHLCSNTPHTCVVAVSPPGKLGKMVAPMHSAPKVACVAIRQLMLPHSAQFPLLHTCLTACASLAGKELAPDPTAVAAMNAAAASASVAAALADGVSSAAIPGAPQYVPILPKPPMAPTLINPSTQGIVMPGVVGGSSLVTSSNIAAGGMMTSPVSGMSSMMQTPSRKLAPMAGGTPGSSIGRPQLPLKPPVPQRPAVRHIPADDWLTYKLDHAKLYKCGADISKELENHSLYIHDVADIWALYPRQFAKPEIIRRTPSSVPTPSTSGGGGGHHRGHKSGGRGSHGPPPKQRRTAHNPPPPPQEFYDDEDEDLDEDDMDGADEFDDRYAGGAGGYLDASPPRHSRYMSQRGSGSFYRKHQPPPPPPPQPYMGKRRHRGGDSGRRGSPRW